MRKPVVNREYRDRLFTFIFGSEENRGWTLSLYNAVNGSSYTNEEDIEFTTIRNVLYMGMHNDVSFLILNEMNMYEQQSSYNPNMPLRMLQYAGSVYEKYLEMRDLNKYSSRLLQLPVPRLVTFYNGAADKEEEILLRLSDSFGETAGERGIAEPDIEVRVRMININYGQNRELLDACEALKEYAWLTDQIRRNKDGGMSIEEAVEAMLREMPAGYVLRPFLMAHRAEVSEMLLTEYDEERHMNQILREGIEQGIAQGIEQGIQQGIEQGLEQGIEQGLEQGIEQGDRNAVLRMLRKGRIDEVDAAEELHVTVEELREIAVLSEKKTNTTSDGA